MRMLGQEPPQPKLWKAVLGAGVVTFPILYIADVAIFAHRPGWIYVAICCVLSMVFGYQMYAGGPESLRPVRFWWSSIRRRLYSDDAAALIPKREEKTND